MPRVDDFDLPPSKGAIVGAVSSLAALFVEFIFFPAALFAHVWLATVVAGPLIGLVLALLVDLGIDDRLIERIKPLILPQEAVIILSVRRRDAARVVEALTIGQGERPLIFTLPELSSSAEPDRPIPVPVTMEELSLIAARLGKSLAGVNHRRRSRSKCWKQLNLHESSINGAHDTFAHASEMERSVALSAEWLLDNAYIIQGHVEEIRRNLHPAFFKALSVFTEAAHNGRTRAEVVAENLVQLMDARLERDNLEIFIQSFQTETTLTIAELWALPQMLRLALIGHIAERSRRVVRRQFEGEAADFWANRLLRAARRSPDRIHAIVAELVRTVPHPSSHFAEELTRHLYDEETALTTVVSWLGNCFNAPLSDVITREQRVETADQVSLANAITSLRLLSQLDWRDVFEDVSRVDAILWGDPTGIYSRMDFATRDRCRHVVEGIARLSGSGEEAVASAAIELSLHSEGLARHVSYFLIDEGLPHLRERFPHRLPISERLVDSCLRRPALAYVASVALCSSAVWLGCLEWMNARGAASSVLGGLAALLLLPSVEIGVLVVNHVACRFFPPRPLPKMRYENGIPDEFRTLVVVPTQLTEVVAVENEVERLEIRYLANVDANLRYALLTGYADSAIAREPGDALLLATAERAIRALNEKYGAGRFLLLHRERVWCETERRWMEWERKRGKIEQLNRLLCGDTGVLDELALRVGNLSDLEGTRYVITLDSDTQLPRDVGRRLVETISHPLNQAKLGPDGRSVARGYTIIQPRISTSLPSATATRFARLFTNPSGIDPYTHVVSDVYQDLAGQASFLGKGIYDVRVFQSVLADRFPMSHILSHDLIEGEHVRVGLASDVELLELFPADYRVFCGREHRWIRGDWQIADWLLPRVPSGSGKRIPNTLNGLSRWKILDNLRRSLNALACIVLLIVGCLISPAPEICALIVGLIMLAPAVLQLSQRLTEHWKLDPMIYLEPSVNAARAALHTALLPHQAALSLDAIVRVVYRRLISRRLLLEWQTFHTASRAEASWRWITRSMGWIPPFAVVVLGVLTFVHPHAFWAISPFSLLWLSSPAIMGWMGRQERERGQGELSRADQLMLRQLARQTWRFFDAFVGPETHWLPPDNYQELLRVEVANRTSPTNIGLWLLSNLSAHDLGFITGDDVVGRTTRTFETIAHLTKYRGHLLNWYDIESLEPLGQPYVSTVDSGNLLGSIWAFRQGISELPDRPVIGPSALRGVGDTVSLLCRVVAGCCGNTERESLHSVELLLRDPPESSELIVKRLRALGPPAHQLAEEVGRCAEANEECRYWASQVERQVNEWNAVIDRYAAWVETLAEPPKEASDIFDGEVERCRRHTLRSMPCLRELALCEQALLQPLLAARSSVLDETTAAWVERLQEQFDNASRAAQDLLSEIAALGAHVDELDAEMEMGFLYDSGRRHFSVGFNVAERRLDRAYYDLLASEARLGSFVAIARGDVPTDHWWALGRPFGFAYYHRALLSWNGTMFEYLMPLLLTRRYANSLLDRACSIAVACQRAYGRQRGIPWGISEAAFSALDARQIYQYRAFGVPGLGLKRGLEEDMVVAPYASALALAIEPRASVENLRRLSRLARLGMRGGYGYYEAIDYTRHHGPHGERGVIVYAYMAHHQGMMLVAIDNSLHVNVMQERFHSDSRVRATEALLYESVPIAPPLVRSHVRDGGPGPLPPISSSPAPGRVDTALSPTPRAHLLSNGDFHVMITNAGGGYSRWKNCDLTRWRSDSTCDDWGAFCYLRDLDSGRTWSAAYHPTGVEGRTYHVTFCPDKVEIRRRDGGIDTLSEIVVCPDHDAEVRRVTLTNRTSRTCHIEVTSYAELALAPHDADRAHPAFNKLFIQTEALPDIESLLAWRRPRFPDEEPIWAFHTIAVEHQTDEPAEYETDRAHFVGRHRTTANPAALTKKLSGATGYVLDPIFSLRRILTVAPGQHAHVCFVTGAASSRDQAISLASYFRDPQASHRAVELAWTSAQLELRHLRVQPDEAQRFQQLAGHILYPNASLRAPGSRIAKNHLGQSRLWAYGVSGDLPIVVVTVGNSSEVEVVRELLQAHGFWRARGLKCDLLILNEESSSYEQPLQNELSRLVSAHTVYTGVDQPGGVFLRPVASIPEEDLTLLLSAAHAVFIAARGPISQQMSPPQLDQNERQFRTGKLGEEPPSEPLPPLEPSLSNGLGGFSQDGREYVISLRGKGVTPGPWVNVIANPDFGCLISEAGSGYTWSGNSQLSRLTAWSNDALQDPPPDAIYITDRSLGVTWTPTPLPIRESSDYRIRHGQGYSRFEHNSHEIEQDLTVFVPAGQAEDSPVRVQRFRLKNTSAKRRDLVITFYAEWTLGVEREAARLYTVTGWDLQSNSLVARNAFRRDEGGRVAFASMSPVVGSFTGDRTEFLGRNGRLAAPKALLYEGLSGRTGAGFDPCAVLQADIGIGPGEEQVLIFLLGDAPDLSAVRDVVSRYRSPRDVDLALQRTVAFWDGILDVIRVDTPDLAVNTLLNRWLLYQTVSCRLWGRTGFYQSGGAFGFRDQLQDVMALVYSAPQIARNHILLAASRQFIEGDVQHWWHPPLGAGVRTRISDDLLWLPFVTAQYLRVTADIGILDEQVPFLEGRPLTVDEHEAYFEPQTSAEHASLLDHCKRAIDGASTKGPHGLPLIGSGDWNDGMNRVGGQGKGESVWLAWFLICVLNDFADLLRLRGDKDVAKEYKSRANELASRVETTSWDGDWYLRAFFDDGSPLGSHASTQAKIDSLPQSWAVLSGSARKDRSKKAMQSVLDHLVDREAGIVRLFDPPFSDHDPSPGYIQGYPPGIRENGGQYTHGSLWAPAACARLGWGKEAVELLRMMNPIEHSKSSESVDRYVVEPYVVAADIYALPGNVGRGGWTWYTGSSAWMYRIWLEEVLGFKLRGDQLILEPVIHPDWSGFEIEYRHHSATYRVRVENPAHIEQGVEWIELDGRRLDCRAIDLVDDGRRHEVLVRMGRGSSQ